MEGERERNINVREKRRLLVCTLTRVQTCNPGMCPDRESKLQPFTSQDDAQPTKTPWSV